MKYIIELSFPIYNPHLHSDAQEMFRQFQNSSLWLEFAVENVDAEYLRISALGVDNIVPPHDTPFVRRVIFFRDPDGNIITLYKTIGYMLNYAGFFILASVHHGG